MNEETIRPILDMHGPVKTYADEWANPEAFPVLAQVFTTPNDYYGNPLRVVLAYGLPTGAIVFRQVIGYGNEHPTISALPHLPTVNISRSEAKILGEDAIEHERGRYLIMDQDGDPWGRAWSRKRALAKIAKRYTWARGRLSVVDTMPGA